MTSPTNPQHEPTMEEILASIRKIISEDSTEQPPPPPPVAAPMESYAQAPMPEPEPEVLELTQEVQEYHEPVAPPPPFVEPPLPEPVHPADDVIFQSIEETPVSASAPTSAPDEFVSDKTRHAIDEALSDLDFGPEEHAHTEKMPAPVAPIDGLSVEAVFDRAVRNTFDPVLRTWLQEQSDTIVERMRPAIREWMEDNLPAMLKSAVEAEVARSLRARSKR